MVFAAPRTAMLACASVRECPPRFRAHQHCRSRRVPWLLAFTVHNDEQLRGVGLAIARRWVESGDQAQPITCPTLGPVMLLARRGRASIMTSLPPLAVLTAPTLRESGDQRGGNERLQPAL